MAREARRQRTAAVVGERERCAARTVAFSPSESDDSLAVSLSAAAARGDASAAAGSAAFSLRDFFAFLLLLLLLFFSFSPIASRLVAQRWLAAERMGIFFESETEEAE